MIKNLLLRRPLLLLLFCVSYLLFLLAFIPAAQILPRLPLPAGLQLQNISGTLWQGRIGDLSWQKYRLHNLQWEVAFSQLWLARPTIKLSLQDPETAVASGTVSWRGDWSLNNWQVNTSTHTIQRWLSLPVDANGELTLNIDQLTFNSLECQTLTGQLNWQQALLQTPAGELTLGNPIAALSCRNKAFEANIQQDSASLHSETALQLNMQGQYKLQASLQPKPALPDTLRLSLGWLGPVDSQGIIRTRHEGSLSDF